MSYLTVTEAVSDTLEEKKSRFIAHLTPYADFEKTLEALRSEHPKASHHVTAFRYIDDDNRVHEGAKDDGEPSGTSGMPVLKTLIGSDLINVGMIVVRYFGGTKLGTGGLARAYSEAAQKAIKAAKFVTWQRLMRLEFSCGFDETAFAEASISGQSLTVLDREFTQSGITFQIEGPEDKITILQDLLTEKVKNAAS